VSRDWLLYLDDLIEAGEKVGRSVQGRSFEQFAGDDVVFDAVLFNLQVIGEAVKHLPDTARAAMPEVDWASPARLRDLIAHRYFSLDARIVWDVASVICTRPTASTIYSGWRRT